MVFIQEQFNKLATKKDLEKFVTKEHFNKKIEKFVTKKEHKELKEDVKKTKEDVEKILISLSDTKEDVKKLKEDMATKDDISEVLTAVDGIAKSFKDHEEEHISNQAAHDRFQVDIDEIKKHIGLKAPAIQVGTIN